MALDTADKRASALLWGLPFGRLFPTPDAAAEDAGDRQQLVGLYRGILATVVQYLTLTATDVSVTFATATDVSVTFATATDVSVTTGTATDALAS